MKTLPQGTATHVVAAFDPKLRGAYTIIVLLTAAGNEVLMAMGLSEHNGAYLEDCQRAPADQTKPYAVDKENAERLWKLSEQLVGQTFAW